jgi:hypothetical protein
VYLGIILLIASVGCSLDKNYGNLIMLYLIAAILFAGNMLFDRFFLSMAYRYSISEDSICLLYEKKMVQLDPENITEIVMTNYRYIFVINEEKFVLSRCTSRPRIGGYPVDENIVKFARDHKIKWTNKAPF